MSLFDVDRDNVEGAVEFEVAPAAGGGIEAFIAALVRLFVRKGEEGLWWAGISDGGEYFANLGPGHGGRLWTEVCSNAYLPAPSRLTADQENALLRLGWQAPTSSVEDGLANYWKESEPSQLAHGVAFGVDTLVEVYGFSENDEWVIGVEPFKDEEATAP